MKFWLVTGSQHLYGKETLDKVAENVKIMTEKMNQSGIMQYPIVPAGVVTTPAEITDVMTRANNDTECGGVITFMHTFSPSKMWIDGLMKLQKPYCHFHTQFGREIPFDTIDMDFMNLYQSAHGDREHGYIGARLRMPRKVVVGYWQDKEVQQELAGFMAAAAGYRASRKMKVARFGDNMRYVAVTEGDKVQAQINYGWDVSYYPLGDLCKEMEGVTDADVDRRFDEVTSVYTLATDNIESVKYQLKTEIALRRFLERGNFGAFTTDFEDLYGLRQLPGFSRPTGEKRLCGIPQHEPEILDGSAPWCQAEFPSGPAGPGLHRGGHPAAHPAATCSAQPEISRPATDVPPPGVRLLADRPKKEDHRLPRPVSAVRLSAAEI